MKIHIITIEIWRKDWTIAAPICNVELDWLTPERLCSLISKGFSIQPKSELIDIYL